MMDKDQNTSNSETLKCHIFPINVKIFEESNLRVLLSGGISHQYSLSIRDLQNGTVLSTLIISGLVLTRLKLRSCNVDGRQDECMTFIAVLATVEDTIGYRVLPLSELKATPEKIKTIRTTFFVNKFTSIQTYMHFQWSKNTVLRHAFTLVIN
jgi:hypothetical protein